MSHGQDYYANYGGLAVADYVSRYIRGSASEMDRMRRTVALIPPGVSSVLDVGAGHGVFLEELNALRGIAGVGIEITQAKVDYARSRGVDLRIGDAGALEFGDSAFDAVVSCEVLEHLPFGVYERACGELARVAREWVIVTVPCEERRRFIACPYCGARVNPDYHFRSFDEGVLRALVPGFRLTEVLRLGERRSSLLMDYGRKFLERWPRFLICPNCGFGPQAGLSPAAIRTSDMAPTDGSAALSLARRLAAWVPAARRPIWLVGVYRRETGHA